MSGIPQKHIFVVLMVLTGIAAAGSKEFLCSENSESCVKNEDCCDGCCFKEKCVKNSESCIKENDPCSNHACPPNTACHLRKVVCIRAPCPPIPVCKPIDYASR